VQKVELKGAKNVDWDGMTRGSSGNFYIADADDKKLRRDSYTIYKFTEKIINFYNVATESDLLKPPICSTHIRFSQCEALCYDGDYLVVTNELGKIWRYPLEAFCGEQVDAVDS